MKKRVSYSREPISVDDGTWFYEERGGLTVVRQIHHGGRYHLTEQFRIPWRKLEPTIRRHQAIKRAKAAKRKSQ